MSSFGPRLSPDGTHNSVSLISFKNKDIKSEGFHQLLFRVCLFNSASRSALISTALEKVGARLDMESCYVAIVFLCWLSFQLVDFIEKFQLLSTFAFHSWDQFQRAFYAFL